MKRYIYLISPRKIKGESFYKELNDVLKTKKIKYFQLRLKNISTENLIKISKKVKKIVKKNNVKFLINDKPIVAKLIDADGCHIGQKDMNLTSARKVLGKNKIIGVTCHNSKRLALEAKKFNADYVAFGSFFKSRLKPNAIKANLDILKWAKKNIKKPIVAIGGINNANYKKLINAGAKYIALSSFIWDNPKLKPEQAIRKFK